jgi:HD superfamily phosphodiesterase
MDKRIAQVASAMMQKNVGDLKRIEHSLKVYAYARNLGIAELLEPWLLEVLELTALLHDIGIHMAEKKYGKCTSQDQEKEGPPIAREIMKSLSFSEDKIDRVCFVISKHHTFTAVDGIDFQLLVEADFLVNSSEDHMSEYQITHFTKNIFRSESGLDYLRLLYPHLSL